MTAPRKVWRPSASSLSRAFQCETSVCYERPPDEVERPHNAPSKRGDRIHAALERSLLGARMEDVKHQILPEDHVDIEVAIAVLPKLEPIPGLPFVEVECWLHYETHDAMLGVAGCPRPDGYYRGRADVIGMLNGVPCVMDHKAGNPKFQVGPDAPQLGFFCAWLRRRLQVPAAMAIVNRTKDFKSPSLLWEEGRLDAFEARLHTLELKLQAIEAGGAEPSFERGKDCIWCPLLPTCSKWKEGKYDGSDL